MNALAFSAKELLSSTFGERNSASDRIYARSTFRRSLLDLFERKSFRNGYTIILDFPPLGE